MTHEQVVELVRWIGKHARTESRFLTPYPSTSVDAHSLLDKLHELTGIAKEDIAMWVDEGQQ